MISVCSYHRVCFLTESRHAAASVTGEGHIGTTAHKRVTPCALAE